MQKNGVSIKKYWHKKVLIPSFYVSMFFLLASCFFYYAYSKSDSQRELNIIKDVISNSIKESIIIGDHLDVSKTIYTIGQVRDLGIAVYNVNKLLIASYPHLVDTKVFSRNKEMISIKNNNGLLVGYLIVSDNGSIFVKSIFFIVLFILVFIVSLIYYIIRATEPLVNEIYRLPEYDKSELILNDLTFDETKNVRRMLVKQSNELLQSQRKILEQDKKIEMSKLAMQVSHDIRSPLVALDYAVKKVEHIISEEDRVIIRSQTRRIRDIANELISRNKSSSLKGDDKKFEVTLISSSLEQVVTSKRLEYRSNVNLFIDLETDNGYGLFSNIVVNDFDRILSNIINNSVEAQDKKHERVTLRLDSLDSFVRIEIEDNGKGIPADVIDEVCNEGVSYGKEKNEFNSGSGLGLYHAKKVIDYWGGDLSVSSKVGEWTKIVIFLPKSPMPSLMLKELVVSSDLMVVLDDDIGIHQIWRKRLGKHCNNLRFFTCPDKFENWIKFNKVRFILLCDFEFKNSTSNGVDIILRNSLSNSSFLFTSHFENEDLKYKCRELGLKLIPKGSIYNIPIVKHNLNECDNSEVRIIHIDDDTLIRSCWKYESKKRNINIHSFDTPFKFIDDYLNYSFEAHIFIDSELGIEKKGEDWAKIFWEIGFKNIYMSTGSEPELFDKMLWVKGVCGKEFPYSIIEGKL